MIRIFRRGLLWWSQWLGLHAFNAGQGQVRTLAGEAGFHMLQSMAKKLKKKKKKNLQENINLFKLSGRRSVMSIIRNMKHFLFSEKGQSTVTFLSL